MNKLVSKLTSVTLIFLVLSFTIRGKEGTTEISRVTELQCQTEIWVENLAEAPCTVTGVSGLTVENYAVSATTDVQSGELEFATQGAPLLNLRVFVSHDVSRVQIIDIWGNSVASQWGVPGKRAYVFLFSPFQGGCAIYAQVE